MKETIIGAVAVLALVVGLVAFVKLVQLPPLIGAVTGPDSPFPTESHNGISTSFFSSGFIKATTTVCTIKTPAVHSRLKYISLNFTTSSTTATTIRIATSTIITATTTWMYDISSIANDPLKTIFLPTTTDKQIMMPNQYINISMTGGTGTFSPAGKCQAEFQF